ncbi:MAG: hypothetical protein J5821_00585, partial [Alphaproteobacteria bacterium]|nr:hypothetical protein [Alphaproteobacteria bacterium]
DTTIWLIDHGADVNGTFFDTEYEWGRDYFSNIKDEPVAYKRSPLAIAEQHNLTRAVEKLKEKGAISINMRLPDKIRKAADRKYKRKYASDDCESAIEAAFRMYDEAEAQFPENIRRARRAEAEANYEGALKSVSGIYKSEERKGRRVGAEAGYENILRSVSRMYYAATAQSQATAEYRRVRRARAGSDYEDALKSVFSMYKSEEEHIISADEVMRRADIRARRAEARARAEANGDSSLIAACQMILRGKIVAPRQRVVAPMWRVPARRFVFLLICSK